MEGCRWRYCATYQSHSGGISGVKPHDRAVRLWHAATGAALQTVEGHSGSVRSVASVRRILMSQRNRGAHRRHKQDFDLISPSPKEAHQQQL